MCVLTLVLGVIVCKPAGTIPHKNTHKKADKLDRTGHTWSDCTIVNFSVLLVGIKYSCRGFRYLKVV